MLGTDDCADERPHGHARDLGTVDRGEGPTASFDGDGTRHHGESGDGRRSGAQALEPTQEDGHSRHDGE